MFPRLLFLSTLLVASVSCAFGVELEPILEEFGCDLMGEVGEYGWVIRDQESLNETCLFAQFPQGKPDNPYVKIQGRNITLKRISVKNLPGHWETEEVFVNRGAKLTVRLKSRLSHDSCVEVEDKCCGQEYEGRLEVSDSSGRKVYKVTRWSGS
ncbi:MAG: hypothetical protein FWF20_06060 [Betaproteobacteria bacterium]|nr:hypothetical protein [Betaproteobacteria bacterium]MCL2886336.1 hypothetical protein [Betaproteobacteria bacterium]